MLLALNFQCVVGFVSTSNVAGLSQWYGDEGTNCAGTPRLPVRLSNEKHCPVFQGSCTIAVARERTKHRKLR